MTTAIYIVCTKCGVAKAAEEFSRDKRKRNGRRAHCKECEAAYGAAYYAVHKDKVRERGIAYYIAHRDERRKWNAAYYATHSTQKQMRSAIYRVTHKDKVRESRAAYYVAHKDELQKQNAEYHATHKKEARAWRAIYSAAHREEARAYQVVYRATHKDKVRKCNAAWREAHPERWAIATARRKHKRRAREAQAPATLTVREWRAALAAFNHRCAYCGCEKARFHKDHVIALSKGGGLEAGNIVPACRSCNISKKDHNAEVWMKRKGYDYERFASILAEITAIASPTRKEA